MALSHELVVEARKAAVLGSEVLGSDLGLAQFDRPSGYGERLDPTRSVFVYDKRNLVRAVAERDDVDRQYLVVEGKIPEIDGGGQIAVEPLPIDDIALVVDLDDVLEILLEVSLINNADLRMPDIC